MSVQDSSEIEGNWQRFVVTEERLQDLEGEKCGMTFCRIPFMLGDEVVYWRKQWYHKACTRYPRNGIMSQEELSKTKALIERTREKNLKRTELREKISQAAPQVVRETPKEEIKDQEKPLWEQHLEHYSKKTTRFRTYVITEGKFRYVKDHRCTHCKKEFEVGQRIVIYGNRAPYDRLHADSCYAEWFRQRPSKTLKRPSRTEERPSEISQPGLSIPEMPEATLRPRNADRIGFLWFLWRVGFKEDELRDWIQERKLVAS